MKALMNMKKKKFPWNRKSKKMIQTADGRKLLGKKFNECFISVNVLLIFCSDSDLVIVVVKK